MGFKDAHLNITNIYLQTIESTQSIQVMGPCFELPYTALKCVKIKVLIGKKIIVVKCIQWYDYLISVSSIHNLQFCCCVSTIRKHVNCFLCDNVHLPSERHTVPWLLELKPLWTAWHKSLPDPWSHLLVHTKFHKDPPRSSEDTGPSSQQVTGREIQCHKLFPATEKKRGESLQESIICLILIEFVQFVHFSLIFYGIFILGNCWSTNLALCYVLFLLQSRLSKCPDLLWLWILPSLRGTQTDMSLPCKQRSETNGEIQTEGNVCFLRHFTLGHTVGVE